MGRMDQVNELLHHHLGAIINEEVHVENGMITISYVECSPDLKNAKIAISVLPDNLVGTSLEKLRAHSGQIANILSKKIKLRNTPRLKWVFDPTERNASALDKIFEEIEKEK